MPQRTRSLRLRNDGENHTSSDKPVGQTKPITNTSDSNYNLKEALLRLLEKLPPPENKPDFHPVDCPPQFDTEPE